MTRSAVLVSFSKLVLLQSQLVVTLLLPAITSRGDSSVPSDNRIPHSQLETDRPDHAPHKLVSLVL